MIAALALEQLRQPQRAGEEKGEPEQGRGHLDDAFRDQIEGEVEDEDKQGAEEKHRHQTLAPANLQQQILPKQQGGMSEQNHEWPRGKKSAKAR